jgi:hypothetical protein
VSQADLVRFVNAQADVYSHVIEELTEGYTRTHWMWFVFPQLTNLGHSSMAQRYAIRDLAEASRYLADPILGSRLRLSQQQSWTTSRATSSHGSCGTTMKADDVMDTLKMASVYRLLKALDEPELSPRELATRFTDTENHLVSEAYGPPAPDDSLMP